MSIGRLTGEGAKDDSSGSALGWSAGADTGIASIGELGREGSADKIEFVGSGDLTSASDGINVVKTVGLAGEGGNVAIGSGARAAVGD